MIIALDYDATYTADPKFWDDFIQMTMEHGHQVILATYRHPVLDDNEQLQYLREILPCYFTDGKAKKPFLEAQDVSVDIWIDDRPKTVYEDSAWGVDSPELAAWREANKNAA